MLRGLLPSSSSKWSVRSTRSLRSTSMLPVIPTAVPMDDKLFKRVELELRGHDAAVLRSYTAFLKTVCSHLSIAQGKHVVLPYVRWVQWALRSKFVHKKYKLHYETRTHATKFEVKEVTGSTASTFLEYVQRNIPEGVAMRVEYQELRPLPSPIAAHLVKQSL